MHAVLQNRCRFGAACSPIGTAYLEIALLGLCNERQLIRLWHRGYRRQIEARANRSRIISFTKQFRSGFLAVQFGNNSREKNSALRRVLCLGPSVGICPCLCAGRCCAGAKGVSTLLRLSFNRRPEKSRPRPRRYCRTAGRIYGGVPLFESPEVVRIGMGRGNAGPVSSGAPRGCSENDDDDGRVQA
jgi:hypothetical protein